VFWDDVDDNDDDDDDYGKKCYVNTRCSYVSLVHHLLEERCWVLLYTIASCGLSFV
jgi:hypothetical protein